MSHFKRRDPQAYNPWGLSPAEMRVLDALIKAGTNKGAARLLSLTEATIEKHCENIRMAMAAAVTSPLNRVQMLLQYDRWRRLQRLHDLARLWNRHATACWRGASEQLVNALQAEPCTCITPAAVAHCPEHAELASTRL